MSDWLEPGDKAPAFTLTADSGENIKLSQFKGQNVVLYFYPKDDTPGCTKQACAFRDAQSQWASSGAVVLGVSPDSAESHVQFRDKFGLNFPLLADPDHAVAEPMAPGARRICTARNRWESNAVPILLTQKARSPRSGRRSTSMGTMPVCWKLWARY